MLYVLFIDDDYAATRPFLLMWGGNTGIELRWTYAEDGQSGIEQLKTAPIDVVLMDGHLMDDEYGHQVVSQIRALGFATPIVMFSSNEEQNALGIQAGAEFSVNKNRFIEHAIGGGEEADALASIMHLINLKKG
jgi:DNA-binding response OmpR family regulator